VLAHEPDEQLRRFVVLPDGLCAIWLPDEPDDAAHTHSRTLSVLAGDPPAPAELVRARRPPRVTRHDRRGDTLWCTSVPIDGPQWRPSTVFLSHHQPLLISGDRVAASFYDVLSGIGVTFFLDATTGDLIAPTPPGPSGYKAIAGPGEFLIGEQGYGIFRTTRYGRDGLPGQQWDSHGALLVDRHGGILSAEYDNNTGTRLRLRRLNPDGSLLDGPLLSHRDSGPPALDRDGTAVVWRDGVLLAVDADFQARELFGQPVDASGRVLLLADGRVVVAGGRELLIIADTGLGPLDQGDWPCEGGNLNGNPVAYR